MVFVLGFPDTKSPVAQASLELTIGDLELTLHLLPKR